MPRNCVEMLKNDAESIHFFVLWRGGNKSGGWGDILRVRPNTRSHEWGPWVYQWDQQGWCEFSYSQGNEINTCVVERACHKWREVCSEKMFLVAARTAAGVRCRLHCHHYWDTVKNRCGCLVDVQTKPWRKTKEYSSLFLLSLQGYWSDGETLSQHESCLVTQLTAGSQTGLSISAIIMMVFPLSSDLITLKSSLFFFPYLDKTSKCIGFWGGTTDSGRCQSP